MTLPLAPKTAWGFAVLLLAFAGCTSKETRALLQPPQALGIVLADEAARAAGARKQVAVITPDASWGPSSIAEEAFRAAMKKQGFSVLTAKSANLGDPMRSRPGLKAADFVEALEKSADAGAVVSFAGAPLLRQGDAARLGPGQHPPVLVVATMTLGTGPGVASDRLLLANLLEAGIIHLAIIDGADHGALEAAKGDATQELFARNYRILRPPN
ncbi:MAG: hypothetical protein ABSD29_17980 [Verrucomicrobiota bacterium]